uniref:Uncharacterized protein n=1 Tax=Wuchereria bancrofti TaxID=6293 RepID=A0AAF5RU04_WUCBA
MLKIDNLKLSSTVKIFTVEDNFQIQELLSKKRIAHQVQPANPLSCKESNFLSCNSVWMVRRLRFTALFSAQMRRSLLVDKYFILNR